jgi:hypothetical protein
MTSGFSVAMYNFVLDYCYQWLVRWRLNAMWTKRRRAAIQALENSRGRGARHDADQTG